MTALLAGVGSLALGIILLVFSWDQFVDLLRGGIPIMLILGGALAAYLGYEEMKEKSESKGLDTETSDLKNEVESLREKVKELEGEKSGTGKGEE
jgi:uncharacterized protein YlxW (UPF0749 family)